MGRLVAISFGACCLLITSTEGSFKARGGTQPADRDYYCPVDLKSDDSDPSSHFMSSSFDEEERILSALEHIAEERDESVLSGLAYRPKVRGVVPLYELRPRPRRLEDQITSGKQDKRDRARKRMKVAKGPKSPVAKYNDDRIESSSSVPCREETQDDFPNHTESIEAKEAQEGKEKNVTMMSSSHHISVKLTHQQHQPSALRIDSNGKPGPMPVAIDNAVSSTTPWVRRYLNLRPKDVLLPVPKEFIADGFNLVQLAPIVERIGFQVLGSQAVEIAKRLVELPSPQPSYPIYRLALRLLLSENEDEESMILQHPLIPQEAIEQAAEALFLLVHARFTSSPRGLDALRRILRNSPVFGKCPCINCAGAMLLPHGACDNYTCNAHMCQRYCPSCGNLWNFWDSKTDGSAWGPSLCYLLLLAHGHELYPMASRRPSASLMSTDLRIQHPNDPRIFGFRIHPAAAWGRPLTG